MAGAKTLTAGDTTVQRVKFGDVILDHARNIRPMDESHVVELVALIKANGLTRVPTVLREDGKLYVERGFHTWEALTRIRGELGEDAFAEIAVEVIEQADEGERRVLHLVEQMSKRDLSQAEVSENVAILRKLGMSPAAIGKRLGKDKTWAEQAIAFHKSATAELKAASRSGAIANTNAKEAAKLPAPAQKIVAIDLASGRSARDAIDQQRAAVGQRALRPRKLAADAVTKQADERGIASRSTGSEIEPSNVKADKGGVVANDVVSYSRADLEVLLERARSGGILAGAAWVLGLVADPEVAAEDGSALAALREAGNPREVAAKHAAETRKARNGNGAAPAGDGKSNGAGGDLDL